jgi:hypothetical protein
VNRDVLFRPFATPEKGLTFSFHFFKLKIYFQELYLLFFDQFVREGEGEKDRRRQELNNRTCSHNLHSDNLD